MDKIDYTFKFSTEIIVLGLSLIIIIFNVSGTANMKVLDSNNLFAKALSDHAQENKYLYSENTAVQTVVIHDQTIIPEANAQAVLASTNIVPIEATSTDPNTTADNTIVDDNTITNPNPSSVRTMILDQVKVYTTVQGDTLASISNKFNITPNTIIWANNLTSTTIKPGWQLLILPVSGVLHEVTNNDTLPDIAREFNVNIADIISYNNLVDDSDISPGDMLMIPNGTVKEPAKPKPAVQNKVQGKIYYEPAPDITNLKGPTHIFPYGQCTYYVAERRKITWGGNANEWLYNARAAGAKTGSKPIIGAIMVSTSGRYGHVAYIEKVDGNNFLVSEMNYKGRGVIDERWITVGDGNAQGFIY